MTTSHPTDDAGIAAIISQTLFDNGMNIHVFSFAIAMLNHGYDEVQIEPALRALIADGHVIVSEDGFTYSLNV